MNEQFEFTYSNNENNETVWPGKILVLWKIGNIEERGREVKVQKTYLETFDNCRIGLNNETVWPGKILVLWKIGNIEERGREVKVQKTYLETFDNCRIRLNRK